jgi:hypothetical protein
MRRLRAAAMCFFIQDHDGPLHPKVSRSSSAPVLNIYPRYFAFLQCFEREVSNDVDLTIKNDELLLLKSRSCAIVQNKIRGYQPAGTSGASTNVGVSLAPSLPSALLFGGSALEPYRAVVLCRPSSSLNTPRRSPTPRPLPTSCDLQLFFRQRAGREASLLESAEIALRPFPIFALV